MVCLLSRLRLLRFISTVCIVRPVAVDHVRSSEATASDVLVGAQPRVRCWARALSSSSELVDAATARRQLRVEDATRVGLQFPFPPGRGGGGAPSVAMKWRDSVKAAIMHGLCHQMYRWQPGMPLFPPAGYMAPVPLKRKRDRSAEPKTHPAKRAHTGEPDEAKLWFVDFHAKHARVHRRSLAYNIRRGSIWCRSSSGPWNPTMELPPFALSRLANLLSQPGSVSASSLEHIYRRVLRELDTEIEPTTHFTRQFLQSLQLSWKLAATHTRHRPSEADIATERKLLQLRVICLCDRFRISLDRTWNRDETTVRMVPTGERGWTKKAESAQVFASLAFVTVTLVANMRDTRTYIKLCYVQRNFTGDTQPLDRAYMRAFKSSIRNEVAKHFAEFFLEVESNFECVSLDSSTSVLRQLLLSFVPTSAQNADSPQHRAARWRFIDWNEVEQRELLAEAKRRANCFHEAQPRSLTRQMPRPKPPTVSQRRTCWSHWQTIKAATAREQP